MIVFGVLISAFAVAALVLAAAMPRRSDKPWSNMPLNPDYERYRYVVKVANIEGSHPREGSTPWVEGEVHSSTQHGQDEAPSAHGPFDHPTTISYDSHDE